MQGTRGIAGGCVYEDAVRSHWRPGTEAAGESGVRSCAGGQEEDTGASFGFEQASACGLPHTGQATGREGCVSGGPMGEEGSELPLYRRDGTWVETEDSLKPPVRYFSMAAFSRVWSATTEFWPPAWHAAQLALNT